MLVVQIAVPRSMIGVVIGKGGEMIKKIQQESGARIQFRPEDELGGPNRMCNITGSQEQTQAAHNMIQELVDNTAVRNTIYKNLLTTQRYVTQAAYNTIQELVDNTSVRNTSCSQHDTRTC